MGKTGRRNLLSIVVVFLWCTSSFVFAQEARLTATVSKKTVANNQRLRIEYKINSQEADDFELPNFKNFKVVGGPSQSVSSSYTVINGKAQRNFTKTLTYILETKKKGTFTIPPATISEGGRLLKSNAITIRVVDAVDLPKDPNDPSYLASQNVKMLAVVSKENPYVGEPVYVEYRLYVNQMSIRNYENETPPNYEGFWSQVLKNENPQFKEGSYKGEPWQYAVLHKVLLIPQQSGKLSINSMASNMVVGVPTGRGDFWGNMITKNVEQTFRSPKKTIQVRPLPSEGKPLSFKGAVGSFKLSTIASREVLKANESAQIKVKISGKGNMKLFDLPKIDPPQEFEVYDPERKERVKTTPSGLSGSIENAYTVVPQYKGTYEIPETEFSYFNPKDQKYHVLRSKVLALKITEGKELPRNTTLEQNEHAALKQNVKKGSNTFRYIQTHSEFTSLKEKDYFKSLLYYFLILLPVIILPLALFLSKNLRAVNANQSAQKLKKADKLAKKYLATAKKELGNQATFYEALEKALHNYLKAKLKVETSEISKEKIAEILKNKSVSDVVIKDFIAVFTACEYARYGSSTDEKMQENYEGAKKAITQIDKLL